MAGISTNDFASACASAQSGAGTQAAVLDAVLSEENSHREAKSCHCVCSGARVVVSGGAAAQAVRATVLGTVTDRTGAVLPGATVNVTNTETGVVQSTVADSQGRYAVTDLLPAAYNVEASLSGFQTVVREGIRLVVGTQAVVDFTLGPSAVQETITVTAGAPVVDTVSWRSVR